MSGLLGHNWAYEAVQALVSVVHRLEWQFQLGVNLVQVLKINLRSIDFCLFVIINFALTKLTRSEDSYLRDCKNMNTCERSEDIKSCGASVGARVEYSKKNCKSSNCAKVKQKDWEKKSIPKANIFFLFFFINKYLLLKRYNVAEQLVVVLRRHLYSSQFLRVVPPDGLWVPWQSHFPSRRQSGGTFLVEFIDTRVFEFERRRLPLEARSPHSQASQLDSGIVQQEAIDSLSADVARWHWGIPMMRILDAVHQVPFHHSPLCPYPLQDSNDGRANPTGYEY